MHNGVEVLFLFQATGYRDWGGSVLIFAVSGNPADACIRRRGGYGTNVRWRFGRIAFRRRREGIGANGDARGGILESTGSP